MSLGPVFFETFVYNKGWIFNELQVKEIARQSAVCSVISFEPIGTYLQPMMNMNTSEVYERMMKASGEQIH